MTHQILWVQTTLPNEEIAHDIAQTLVKEGLVACVQCTSIVSHYRWEGKVHKESEVRCDLKTAMPAKAQLLARLTALHPYEVPEILTVERAHASEAYGAWVEDAVTAQRQT